MGPTPLAGGKKKKNQPSHSHFYLISRFSYLVPEAFNYIGFISFEAKQEHLKENREKSVVACTSCYCKDKVVEEWNTTLLSDSHKIIIIELERYWPKHSRLARFYNLALSIQLDPLYGILVKPLRPWLGVLLL